MIDMKRYTTLIILTMMVVGAIAQSLTGRAPSQVAVGEQFRLTYTINTQDVRGFRAGNIPDELEVLMGPSSRASRWSTVTRRVRRQ